jgi:predicted RND superfamily exporter protein
MERLRARQRLPWALVRFSLSHPKAVLMAWLALLLLASFGVLRLRVDTSTDSVLDQDAAAWAFYKESLATFGGDEILVAAIEADAPFAPRELADIPRLTSRLESISGVRRVDSLSSLPLIHATPDGALQLDPALAEGVPRRADELRTLQERVLRDRIAVGSLVSRDGRVLAVNVLLDEDLEGQFERVVTDVRNAVEERGAWVSGVPVFRTEINTRTGSEIVFFSLLTVLIIGSFLLLVFRAAGGVVIPLVAGGIGTWMVLAAMGAAQAPLTLSTMILPSVMLALGCAYAMHMVAAAQGRADEDALAEAFVPVALPVALSGLTTAIGFVAISAVRIEAIQQVGGFGAFGVFVLFSAVLTAVPAALRLWPLMASSAGPSLWVAGPLRSWVVTLTSGRPRSIALASVLIALVFAMGISRLTIETDATRWFPRGTDVREAYEQIREKLSGISPVNVVVESHDGPVTRPEILTAIDDLTAYLEAQPEIGKALSVGDALRQIHGGFAGDPELPLPKDRVLTEQYLLLLESLEHLDDVITPDRKRANILLRVDNNGSKHLLGIGEKVDAWWKAHGPPGASAQATGIMYEFARAEDAIAYGQIRGLAFALVAIGLILLAMYRSARIAAIAMIPNALPILMAFGFMGLAGVPLDAGTVVVGSLAIGIAVDNTVHVVNGFHEWRDRVGDGVMAIDRTLARVLPPVVFTSVVVGVGFAVLGFSQFTFTRHLGMLISGIMVVCLLADALLLPVLLMRFAGAPAAKRV